MTDPAETNFKNQTFGIGDFALNGLHLAIRGISMALPYEKRIHLARDISLKMLSRLPDYQRRIKNNLELIFPSMSPDWHRTTGDDALRNIGQSLMEHMHMTEFGDRIGHLNIAGDGVLDLDPSRGAMIVSGHFGQWEAVRIAWRHMFGTDCAFFFRPNNNGFYDRHWQKYLKQAGTPIIPKSSTGKSIMTRHLAGKGALLMVIDQRIMTADRFDFMGHPARTATTAAELAIEYDLPLIPAYGIRRDNLVDYDVVFETELPRTTPAEMTQALNTSLASRIETNPEQYLWTHRRWL